MRAPPLLRADARVPPGRQTCSRPWRASWRRGRGVGDADLGRDEGVVREAAVAESAGHSQEVVAVLGGRGVAEPPAAEEA